MRIDYDAVDYILHIKYSIIIFSLLNKSFAHKQQWWKSYNSIDLFQTGRRSFERARSPAWAETHGLGSRATAFCRGFSREAR